MAKRDQETVAERIIFRMHPRVFAALGADLVTNDVVAVTELVKNSYDAFASRVWIRFLNDDKLGECLEIEDDGCGMTRDVIENAWCLVATPFKKTNSLARRGKGVRRVAGDKGLGRLSAARLGDRLHMLTRAEGSECWEVEMDWTEIASHDSVSSCAIVCRRFSGEPPFRGSGTRIRIYGLKEAWDEGRIADLEENLARLISPFGDAKNFDIFFKGPEEPESGVVPIESPEFLSRPKYGISGGVDESGNIRCRYEFRPIRKGKRREKDLRLTWEHIWENARDRARFSLRSERAHCGPFTFEIRAWDVTREGTEEIAQKFDIEKGRIRRAIRAHKGISVYRDGVLVLPKSDNARDWLGLDLQRVSRVGTRLSTSQIVGYVSISAESNPKIRDTSDRERLASCLEVAEFEELLNAVVGLLENERESDREKADEKPMTDLLDVLEAEETVAEVEALAEEGAGAGAVVPLLRAFGRKLGDAREKIRTRFAFYSRMATVGTIAQMLVHEIRNRTTVFGEFLDLIRRRFGPFHDEDAKDAFRRADAAVDALERLADTFSPLASRAFRRRRRHSVLEERVRGCLDLLSGDIKRKRIACRVPGSKTAVAVDPGELDAILLNVIGNAVYWLSLAPEGSRTIEFRVKPAEGDGRIRVWIHDSGPGLSDEDVERVFWPGVTRKPEGIGMGLTVAAELVEDYGGRMLAKHPGARGGASFGFDLPLAR